MEPNYNQRRRIVTAGVVTLVLVAMYTLLYAGSDEAAAPTVTVVGTVADPADTTASPLPANSQPGQSTGGPLGEIPTGYLTGESEAADDDTPTIIIPRPTDVYQAKATFDRDVAAANCFVPDAPTGNEVEVTNIDNGRSVSCNNSRTASPNLAADAELDGVILSAEKFILIADLTDSPIPVEVTW